MKLRYQRDVDRLAPQADRYEVYFEDPIGLGVRVAPRSGRYPAGRKTYTLFYRTREGRFRRYTFKGTVENWTLAEVKNEARKLLGEVAKGGDPQGDKQAAKAAETERKALRRRGIPESRKLSTAIERYLSSKGVAEKKSVGQKRAHLEKDVLGVIGDVDIGTITRTDIEKCLQTKIDKGASVSANRVLAHSRTLFRWLVANRLIEIDPTQGVAKPLSEEKVRNRFLEQHEIKTFWNACESITSPYGQLFRFALLTAARRNECAFMEWSEIDWNDNIWMLPAVKVKGGRDHILPLSSLALEIVKSQPKIDGSPYVFARADGGSPNAWSAATAELNEACGFVRMNDEDAPGSWLSAHDLRRTCTEGLDRQGVDPFIVDRILNHSQGKLKKAYRRWQYVDEKRTALEAWSLRIGGLTND